MSCLVNCVKFCCYKICTTVGLTKPKHPPYSNSLEGFDEGQRVSILNSSQSQQTKSLKSKHKSKPKPEAVMSDIVGIDGAVMGENNRKSSHESVPTKDSTILSTTNSGAQVQQQKEAESYVFNTNSFKIELQPYENYYQILHSKTKNIHEKLNVPSTPIDLEKAPCSLKIRHSESGKLNILIYKFKLPCSYAFYNEMLNDYTLQKNLDNNVDQYKLLELYSNNFRLNYLSYKKVLIVSPRDFVYLKYSNSAKNNENWDISFSIPWENIPYKVRGEIILSCSKITEREDEIEVEVYSEVDMKLSVSPKITKNQAVNEIKKYVQKCDKYIKQNYKKSLI